MGLYYLAEKVVTQEKHVETDTIRVITSQKVTKLTTLMASYTKQSHVRRVAYLYLVISQNRLIFKAKTAIFKLKGNCH